MKVALTGGIACGKSLIATYLNEFGVETIDADDVVHELIPAAERKRLAAVVFRDPVARRELEARIHPIVQARIAAFLESRCAAGGTASSIRLAVIPLLFEAHWEKNFDIICCVKSEREAQVSRMMTTRGYTREEAEARLAAQLPVAEKAAKSHYVIENDGSSEDLREKVRQFVVWLGRKSEQFQERH